MCFYYSMRRNCPHPDRKTAHKSEKVAFPAEKAENRALQHKCGKKSHCLASAAALKKCLLLAAWCPVPGLFQGVFRHCISQLPCRRAFTDFKFLLHACPCGHFGNGSHYGQLDRSYQQGHHCVPKVRANDVRLGFKWPSAGLRVLVIRYFKTCIYSQQSRITHPLKSNLLYDAPYWAHPLTVLQAGLDGIDLASGS